jgi:(heptosyl)LPS beta-1,4-glucosyltransferase
VNGDASVSSGDGAVLLSACLIARDEEEALPDCLASVAFCDEIVLVDSGSTDRTVAIAEAAGVRVVHQRWLGFAAQRNVALDHASGRWVLEIDCDERVSPGLQREIAAFVRTAPEGVDLAGLPRRHEFVGRRLGPSAKYPAYVHRLLRRGAHRHDERRTVHEGLVPDGTTHPFEHELEHLLARTWREALTDAWTYARLEADQIHAPRSVGAVVRGALVRPAAKVAYRVAIDGGWRDGRQGLAKIALDAATDSAVWVRHGLRGARPAAGDSGRTAEQHYGAFRFHRGTAKIVGVAFEEHGVAEAEDWLAAARGAGAEVALVTHLADGPIGGVPVPVRRRRLPRAGWSALTRALDAESMLRPYDALVAFDGRAARVAGRLPRRLRGAAVEHGWQVAPADVCARVLADREAAGC